MIGLVILAAILCAICFVASGVKGEKGKNSSSGLCFFLGAFLLVMMALSSWRDGFGNAGGKTDLDEQGNVYCVAAKVDDTYIVRKAGENKNLTIYLPHDNLAPGDCFVKSGNVLGKVPRPDGKTEK